MATQAEILEKGADLFGKSIRLLLGGCRTGKEDAGKTDNKNGNGLLQSRRSGMQGARKIDRNDAPATE
jgi:hypothetical protein